MAERAPTPSPSSLRAAGLLLLAAGLGALAGSQWERRVHPAPPSEPSLRGSTTITFIPAGLGPVTELSPADRTGVGVRRDLRNLFDYTESPAQRAMRLENEHRARIAELKSLAEIIEQGVREAAQIQADILWHQLHDPPPVKLELIGKMGPPRAQMAILTAPDGEIYYAHPGEIVAGRYRLVALDFDTATIGYADALVAAQPEWAGRRTVLRMGAR